MGAVDRACTSAGGEASVEECLQYANVQCSSRQLEKVSQGLVPSSYLVAAVYLVNMELPFATNHAGTWALDKDDGKHHSH